MMQVTIHSLAVELLSQIAVHVALDTPSNGLPVIRPPSDLVSLFLTCRSFNQALNQNSLFATLFRQTFDTSALYRRFPASSLTAPVLAAEYKRRWSALKRIREKVVAPPSHWHPRRYRRASVLEDLMTMFLLFIESDGKNAAILFRYAGVITYLRRYKQDLISEHASPDMPDESEETSLYLWLRWFASDYFNEIQQMEDERANLEWLLTPYLMGTFKYGHTYGPWVFPSLPRPQPETPSSSSSPRPSSSNDPLVPWASLDARPASTAIPGGYLAGPSFTFPFVHHAAILLKSLAIQIRPPHPGSGEPVLPDTPDVPSDESLLSAALAHGHHASASTITSGARPLVSQDAFTPSYMRVRFPSIADSRRWDDEWARLVGCRDPTSASPTQYRYSGGSMTGDWDGRFMICDTSALGRLEAALGDPTHQHAEYPLNILEDAHLFHDAQSWTVTEYHYRPLLSKGPPVRLGHPLNGHLPNNLNYDRMAIWDASRGRWMDGLRVTEGRSGQFAFYEAVTLASSGALPVVPSDSVGILVVGHATAPPSYSPSLNRTMGPGSRLIGTVRTWDGLISLRATSERHGSFVYTGYLVGGGMRPGMEEAGNWVGRWRDTIAQLGKLAWEGTFCMRKRAV